MSAVMTLSPVTRKILALGLAAILMAVVWLFAIAPIAAYGAARSESLALQRERLARLAALGETASAWDERARDAQALVRDAVLPGETAGEASAALQSRLFALVQETGGEALSVRVLDAGDGSDDALVLARVSALMDDAGLIQALERLETETPALIVTLAEIELSRLRNAQDRPLQVELELAGLRQLEDAP